MRAVRRLLVALCLLVAGCGGAAACARAVALRQVDDFPLYELTDSRPTPSVYARTDTTGFACTVFFGAGGEPIMGRNFDFHDQPALLLRHRPPGKYASLSMVDISYLGFDRANLRRVRHGDSCATPRACPFDGMNERGLAVAMAQVPDARSPVGRTGRGLARRDATRARRGGERRARRSRSSAAPRSTSPAARRCTTWSPTRAGTSAVVEYVDGRVHVIPRGERPFQAMTNFVLTGGTPPTTATARPRPRCAAPAAALTPGSTLALLARVAQPHTRWSVAYDLRARTAHVVMGQKYGGAS